MERDVTTADAGTTGPDMPGTPDTAGAGRRGDTRIAAYRRWLIARLDTPAAAVLVNLVVLSATTNLTLLLVSTRVEVAQSSLWFLCLSASSLLFVADMGVSYALSRHLARHRRHSSAGSLGASSRRVARYFARTCLPPFLILDVALGAYLVFARQRAGATDIEPLLLLWGGVSLYMLFAVFAKYLQMVNEGLGRLKQERYIVSACQLAAFALAAVLVPATDSIWPLPLVYSLGFAAQAMILYRATGPGTTADPLVSVDDDALHAVRRDSRNLWLLSIATVVSQNVQVMSLAIVSTPGAIAAFFFLQRLDNGASNLIGVIPVIDRARVTFAIGNGDHATALAIIRRNILIVVIAAIACATLLFGGVALLDHWKLLKFHVPWLLLSMFTADLLVSSVLGVFGQYVLAAGRNPLIPWTVACCVLTVALQFLLVPHYGSIGAIGAFLVAQLLTTYVANTFYFLKLVQDLRKG